MAGVAGGRGVYAQVLCVAKQALSATPETTVAVCQLLWVAPWAVAASLPHRLSTDQVINANV